MKLEDKQSHNFRNARRRLEHGHRMTLEQGYQLEQYNVMRSLVWKTRMTPTEAYRHRKLILNRRRQHQRGRNRRRQHATMRHHAAVRSC